MPSSYPALPLSVIRPFLALAAEWGVSEVARGERVPALRGDMPINWPRGFIPCYLRAGGRIKNLPLWWQQERERFVARHMAQVRQRREPLWRADGLPTRRHLALICWAYSPAPERVAALARASGA